MIRPPFLIPDPNFTLKASAILTSILALELTSMEPEFLEDDIVIINPYLKQARGLYPWNPKHWDCGGEEDV